MKLKFNKEYDLRLVSAVADCHNHEDIEKLRDNDLFDASKDSIFPAMDLDGKGAIYVGLGEKDDISEELLINSFFKLSKEMRRLNIKKANLRLPCAVRNDDDKVMAVLEGFLQEEYRFDDYKAEKKEIKELKISLEDIEDERIKDLEDRFEELENLIAGVAITRNLVNIPSNDLYPETLANKVVELFEGTNVEVEVLDKKQCEDLGMEAMLQVARGSAKEPKFIIMRYLPLKDDDKHLTFVGKGLTYDSGGYAIKPASGMVTMKSDMGGAASVIGAMYALNKNKVQKNVVGVVAAVENMISGDAYKNGDIIGSMKGLTIEIGNTDAEGRVTLADSLYYSATKLNSTAIVDLATLTGACIVALGERVTGLVSNNTNLCNLMVESSIRANELTWRYPVFETHRDQVKGSVGDLKNSTKGGAGSITAGVFLEHFVENTPWVHMDIAGPAWADSPFDYIPAGGTGVPVKTIYEFAKAYDAE